MIFLECVAANIYTFTADRYYVIYYGKLYFVRKVENNVRK